MSWWIGWSLLTAVFFAPVVRQLSKTRKLDWFAVIYPVAAYYYIGVGIRGLLICAGIQKTPYREVTEALQGDPGIAAHVFVVAALGLAALYAGYFMSRAHRVGERVGRWSVMLGPHRHDAVVLTCSAYGVIAIATSLYLWHLYGLKGGLLPNPAELIQRSTKGGQFIITGWARFAFVGTLVSAVLAAQQRDYKARIALIINVIAVLLWFLVSSEKESLLFLAVGLLIVRNYSTRRLRLLPIFVGVFIFLAAYPMMFLYRYRGVAALADAPTYVMGSEWFMRRSHQFDLAVVCVDNIEHGGALKYGSTLAELLYFYVPRKLWKGKPMSFGYRFVGEYTPAEIGNGDVGGETPSLLGELFLNGDLFGVLIGMFVFGVILRELYVFLWAGGLSPVKLGMYGLFVLDAMHLVEGPIASHVSTFIVDLMPVLFLGIIGRMYLAWPSRREAGQTR